MNTSDSRFIHAVLGYGSSVSGEPRNIQRFDSQQREWESGDYKGVRFQTYSLDTVQAVPARLVLTRAWSHTGTALATPETMAGIEIKADPDDLRECHHVAPSRIGHIPTPETSEANRETVQIDVGESLPDGYTGFGLTKLRGKVVWHGGGHHIIRFTHEMPTGWPAGHIHERAEAAITGRTATLAYKSSGQHHSHLYLGLPWMRNDRRQHLDFCVTDLQAVVTSLKSFGTG